MPIVREIYSTTLLVTIDDLHLQANKLSTVKKCLNEVLKYGGPLNPRELYPVRP